MSKPNPFQKGNNNATNGPQLSSSTATMLNNLSQQQKQQQQYNNNQQHYQQQQQTYDRSFSRQNIRKDEQLSRKQQYRQFIDTQQEVTNFMSKSAGRKMSIDTTRPIHRVWMGLIGIMVVYSASSWFYVFTRPSFHKMMNLTNDNYSISMMSPDELDILGPIAPQAKYIGKDLTYQESTLLKQKKAKFLSLEQDKQDTIVPCYNYGNEFKQCMSYEKLNRHLDQCMLPLQQYNQCLLKHRIGSNNNNNNNNNNTNNISTITNIAQQVVDNTNVTNNDVYFIPVKHEDYKY